MHDEDKIHGSLQENILTLLCFSDTHAPAIRSVLNTKNIFDNSVYRDIAGVAIDFLDQYSVAPKEHLPDLLEYILKGEDKRRATLYENALDNLFGAREHVNAQYTMDSLSKFIRIQLIKTSVVKAAEFLEKNDVDQAEIEISSSLNKNIAVFDPGTFFGDPERSLRFYDMEQDVFPTGIEVLDNKKIGPTRKELFLFMGPPKRGKSWGLIQLGKHALLNRKKVLHITLEMSEERVAQRYVQAFFAMTTRQSENIQLTKLNIDSQGRLVGIDYEQEKRKAIYSDGMREELHAKIARIFSKKSPLIIKSFPMASLTLNALKAYLDSMERLYKFVPDEILIDYPDLMFYKKDNPRVEIGAIYQGVRGIGEDRNMAMVAVTQTNRTGASAFTIDETHVAEDFSKIAVADNVITINSTEKEHEKGLGRLYVSNGRNDQDKFSVLITRNINIGQFALDSYEIRDESYIQMHKSWTDGSRNDRDDEEL